MKRLAARGSAILQQPPASLQLGVLSGNCAFSARYSSLSAIHRGLRRSERAQYGAVRSPRASSADYPDGNRGRGREQERTTRALDGASSYRQQSKLRKKLDRKQQEDEVEDDGRQTRRKRFLDPSTSFGKSSIVYQLKHGALRDEIDPERLQKPVRPTSRQWWDGEQQDQRRDDVYRESRGRDRPRQQDGMRRRTDFSDRGNRRLQSPSRGETTAKIQPFDRDSQQAASTPRPKMMPMAIKYTTAASQFLYGRSVVKAALEQSRRKLYNLYVYGGANRADSAHNDTMIRLAERQGVPVTIVPNDEQRLMDKMSMGRPHNGFVLETSPLPQMPITGLGRLVETSSRLGFHVELAHQTKEEEAVNGTQTFVPRASNVTPRPLVLLLHEILDPGNLGALLRTASYLGVDAVGITSRSSSTLTPVVLKSAAGAVEEITIFSVDSPTTFLEKSREAGWKTYAAVAPPERKLARKHGDKFVSIEAVEKSSPLDDHPCVLVLGNEGYGLPRPVKVAADYEVSVPRFIHDSCVDSLNVSVAAGLLCHAFVKGTGKETARALEDEPVRASAQAEEAACSPAASGQKHDIQNEIF